MARPAWHSGEARASPARQPLTLSCTNNLRPSPHPPRPHHGLPTALTASATDSSGWAAAGHPNQLPETQPASTCPGLAPTAVPAPSTAPLMAPCFRPATIGSIAMTRASRAINYQLRPRQGVHPQWNWSTRTPMATAFGIAATGQSPASPDPERPPQPRPVPYKPSHYHHRLQRHLQPSHRRQRQWPAGRNLPDRRDPSPAATCQCTTRSDRQRRDRRLVLFPGDNIGSIALTSGPPRITTSASVQPTTLVGWSTTTSRQWLPGNFRRAGLASVTRTPAAATTTVGQASNATTTTAPTAPTASAPTAAGQCPAAGHLPCGGDPAERLLLALRRWARSRR